MSNYNIKKLSQEVGGTSSRYVDADGVEFSAQEIVKGFKPKKPYKLKSLSDKVLKQTPKGK